MVSLDQAILSSSYRVVQGSATPGSRAKRGTPEGFA